MQGRLLSIDEEGYFKNYPGIMYWGGMYWGGMYWGGMYWGGVYWGGVQNLFFACILRHVLGRKSGTCTDFCLTIQEQRSPMGVYSVYVLLSDFLTFSILFINLL